MKILLTGGGSGGHISPLVAVAGELRAIGSQYDTLLEVHYLGPLDQHSLVLKDEGIILHSMLAGKIRRYLSLMNLIDIPKFFLGSIQAFFKVFLIMPDAIFSKGGPGAFPVVAAGWFYRIPVVIHESDAVPGLTTLLSAWFSEKICLSFENATKYFNPNKTIITGTPVRKEIIGDDSAKQFAKAQLGFKEGAPLVLVLGGSQGSKRLNELISSALADLINSAQVLHQTGVANFDEAEKMSKAVLVDIPVGSELEHRYKAVPYLDKEKMKLALSASDLVIARAGSGTIFELAASGKPAILIPLKEAANDHQRANAYAFAETGAATVIEEGNLGDRLFLGQVKTFLKNPNDLAAMGKRGQAFYKPDAASRIAEEIVAASA